MEYSFIKQTFSINLKQTIKTRTVNQPTIENITTVLMAMAFLACLNMLSDLAKN